MDKYLILRRYAKPKLLGNNLNTEMIGTPTHLPLLFALPSSSPFFPNYL